MSDFGQVLENEFGSMNYGGSMYRGLQSMAQNAENELMDNISKALTTGDGIVSAGTKSAGDGSPLRTQLLWGTLEKTSASQDDFALIKRIKKHKVYSNTFEWSQLNQFGGEGDNFISESSQTFDWTGYSADDMFTRLVQQVRYMYAVREIGIVANHVKSIQNPEKVAEDAMRTELLGKMNLAMYWGDSLKQAQQFDGIEAQLMKWCASTTLGGLGFTQDTPIMFDAGGKALNQELLNEAALVSNSLFGDPSTLLMSTVARQDTMKLLYPYQRTEMGSVDGAFGVRSRTFASDFGDIALVADKTLRVNKPLSFDGIGSNGKPRSTASTGAPAYTTATLCPAGCMSTPAAAGTGNFWEFASKKGYAGTAVTSPAVPSNTASFGNQTNNLAAGTYYYAVSAVDNGKESLPVFIKNNGTVGTTTLPVVSTNWGCVVGAGQTVKLSFTNAGLTANTTAKFRIYRTPALSTYPSSINQFDLLAECGQSSDATTIFYDNGFYIPGTDTAFLMTESKAGTDSMMLAQLLPLMLRALPNKLMTDPIAILAFIAPIIFVPRHHVIIRNIGRLT